MVDTFRIPIGPEVQGVFAKLFGPYSKLVITETGSAIKVAGTDFEYEFNAETGLIQKAAVGGSNILIGGPELMLLALNGSGGTQMRGSDEFEPFTETCTNWRL